MKEHKEVFTVETLMKEMEGVEGVVTKNLFLRDKKKKLYLLSARHDKEVNSGDSGWGVTSCMVEQCVDVIGSFWLSWFMDLGRYGFGYSGYYME